MIVKVSFGGYLQFGLHFVTCFQWRNPFDWVKLSQSLFPWPESRRTQKNSSKSTVGFVLGLAVG